VPNRRLLGRLVDAVASSPPAEQPLPHDFSELDAEIWHRVRPYTMTSRERVYALLRAVEYVVRSSIPGAFVESGVWKGGSMMAAALTLLQLDVRDRELYLFDTFEGMPEPGPLDVKHDGAPAAERYRAETAWASAPLEGVREAVLSTGYPSDRIRFVRGLVEDTIPGEAPADIALLRLDTDWYESTRHELECLYPRLASGGVLIIDDYGHWRGACKAVDEYVERNDLRLLLNRIDNTGRVAVKP
jgi:O-methyltransferase